MSQVSLNSTGVASAGALVLQSNGTTAAVTIDTSQNVGIGTSSPATTLQARKDSAGGTTYAIYTDNGASGAGTNIAGIGFANAGSMKSSITSAVYGNDYIAFNVGGSGTTERARIDSSGNLLVGATTSFGSSGCTGVRKGSTGQLILGADSGGLYHQAVGNYYLVTTAGGSTSDASLKTNVQQLTGALQKVCAIRGVNFDFIDEPMCTADQGTQLGVIAQEVEAQYPEIVLTNDNGVKTVRYDRLVAPLIEAIKEQQALITTLTERITALEQA
jgi:hypothetical protein